MADDLAEPHVVVPAESIPMLSMAEVFAKRPGTYIGQPVTFNRVLAFIDGFDMAIGAVRREAGLQRNAFYPAGATNRFEAQLLQEGRLRWGRWDLTVLAESLGWTDEEPPSTESLTDEQELAAIKGLIPLLDMVFALPTTVAGPTSTDGEERTDG